MLAMTRLRLDACACLAVALLASGEASAATRRALLIGIDVYTPSKTPANAPQASSSPTVDRGWIDLDGACNDARAMREVLIARFGFEPQNVRMLTNAEATRAAILEAFVQSLVHPTRPGDVCVFFYAGHGSQMQNSRCIETDCKDETVVPADANHGAIDIRDKEWERLFNDAIDKGALLSIFFDSCHSGSISRGLPRGGKVRFLVPDPMDAANLHDPDDPRPAAKDRGALVLAATQEFQAANEVVDGQGVPHGAFSLALVRTLRSMPPDESAENVFRRVRALVQSNGARQDPTLEGSAERRSNPLFGGVAVGSGRTAVAVKSVAQDGTCVLQGGAALGLCTGCELRRLVSEPEEEPEAGAGRQPAGKPSAASPATSIPAPVRLRVETVSGLDRCVARVVSGRATDIAPGDLFEIERWMECTEPFLRVWMPPTTLSHDALKRVARDLAPLQVTPGIRWISDPLEQAPTYVLSWNGSTWLLEAASGKTRDLGNAPTARTVRDLVRPVAGDSIGVFVYFPPPPQLAAMLRLAPANPESPIEITTTRAQAHYLLVGRVRSDTLGYAWVLPNTTHSDAVANGPLPERTEWCAVEGSAPSFDAVAAKLANLARRTGSVRMWLQLEPPPADGRFPYRLALRNSKGDIPEGSAVYAGETLNVFLRADAKKLRRSPGARWVYVFAIDRHGQSQLLLPRSGEGNSGNRVGDPLEDGAAELAVREVVVAAPFGTDTYVLLWSKEPLPDPEVLEGRAVRSRGGAGTPLTKLLQGIATSSRGVQPREPTPVDWSVQRFSLRSVPALGLSTSNPHGSDR